MRSFGAGIPRVGRATVFVVACLLFVAGCTAGSTPTHRAVGTAAPSTTSAAPAPTGPPPVITVLPGAATADVVPTDPVTVQAEHGTLVSVALAGTDGSLVSGELSADGTSWQSTDPLAYSTDYTVTAVAQGQDGQGDLARSAFSTVAPQTLVFPAIGPLDGTTVGIGMPVRVYLDAPATDRAAVQQHLKVTSDPPQAGSWSWLSDTEVHWRPQAYWQAGTTVTVAADLLGVDFGGGAWGKVDREISFTVGDAHISIANAQTHQMQTFNNGTLVKTIPVALGLEVPGRYTKSGPHVVIDKNRKKTMDSTTYGLALDAGGYVTEVDYATRISNNGEFVHSAPWSIADQGVRNVSHGCINASPDNAAWFFNFSQVGDVVKVVGTPVSLGPADGDIYDWAVPWPQWVAGSALP